MASTFKFTYQTPERKRAEEGRRLPIGGKSAKMREPFYGNKKAAEEAYDHVQNMKEEDAELSESTYDVSDEGMRRKKAR